MARPTGGKAPEDLVFTARHGAVLRIGGAVRVEGSVVGVGERV
jgi:hypothetical protein